MKIIKVLEKLWLMVAIVCIILAIYKSIFLTIEEGLYFGLFSVLATALYLLRRRMRIRMENSNQEKDQS